MLEWSSSVTRTCGKFYLCMRLIGTLRRDCLDHVLIFGERHLRRILTLYFSYYNETRTYLCWTRIRRCDERSKPVAIAATLILSGLPHQYARI
jgi:hypothetical protein